MIAALRYEWVRIRTIRSTIWLSVIALVFGIGLSFLIAMGTSFSFASENPPGPQDIDGLGPGVVTQFAALGAPYFVAYILAMIGVFAWGHEYRHGMIRATLTALNSRTASWIAKFLVVGLWVLVIGALTMLGSLLVGLLWLSDDPVELVTSATAGAIVRTLVYTLLLTWLAAAFTALTRNQTAALVLLFLWPLAVENVITLVFQLVPALRSHQDLTRFLPFNAGSRIVDQFEKAGSVFGQPLSLVGALLIFGGLAVIGMVASLALFHRRDA
jgi:ABC-2 type transport system permease protein